MQEEQAQGVAERRVRKPAVVDGALVGGSVIGGDGCEVDAERLVGFGVVVAVDRYRNRPGGIGPGEGGGLGPGRGGNIGGGDRNDGGGGPGGGGGGDYNRIFTGKDVTTKARLISKPEPQYTEDARKNQVTGTVVLKVVFASNGSVQNIRTVSVLPYGLTERAIAAARQIKFVPATKDGHQVSMWMQLEYNFNLY